MSITYKSGGVNRQYSGSAVVIKDAADALHFFEAAGEKTIGISGPLRVAADAGTATYTVTGAGSLGSIFTWSVEGGGGLTWSISSGGVLTIPSGVAAGTTASIMLKFGDMIVAGQQIVIEAAAPATYDIEIPTETGATITVLVNGAAYTSGKLTHGASVKITVAAQPNYNITSSSVTMGGQPVTGSNGEYNISSVTGAVVISATAEAVEEEPPVTSATLNVYHYNYAGTVENPGGIKHKATSGSDYLPQEGKFNRPLNSKPIRFTVMRNKDVSVSDMTQTGNFIYDGEYTLAGGVWTGHGKGKPSSGVATDVSPSFSDSDEFWIVENGKYVGVKNLPAGKVGSGVYYYGKWITQALKDEAWDIFTFYTE